MTPLVRRLIDLAYARDDAGVWARPGTPGVAYADGAEALLERYFDGDPSAVREPPEHLRWPLLYHLSPARQALLAPAALRGRVIELGAGMGAVTGGLLAAADEVLAVEGAPARARVLRKRFPGEARLEVLCDDLFGLAFAAEFDAVTAVGVLEYAPESAPKGAEADAACRFLSACAGLLRPGGRLVLAIENAFGAKYWSGCNEDHHGAPFVGVEGYDEGRRGARTYAREELCRLVVGAGLRLRAVYGCWPDYKFPVWLVDADAPGEEVVWLAEELPPAPCPDHRPTRLLREPALVAATARGGLLGHFWNSYLLVAER